MATSPADVVLAPGPMVDHGHEVGLALLGFLAVAVLVIVAQVLLVPRPADPGGGTTPRTTTSTYRPAVPIHRLGPAQPQLPG